MKGSSLKELSVPIPTLQRSENVTLLLEVVRSMEYPKGGQTLFNCPTPEGVQHRQKLNNENTNVNKICVGFSLLISVPYMVVREQIWRRGVWKYSVPSAQFFLST